MERFENMYPMISPDGLPSLLEEEYGMELDDKLDRFVESDKVEVIPAVGRKVYIVYPDEKMIFEEEVYALGRDSFILECFTKWTRKHSVKEDQDTICCVTTNISAKAVRNGQKVIVNGDVRILTPKEVFRFMGFGDQDHEKASKHISDSKLYKQAGNSIVVQVLEAIFKQMI